MKVELSLDKEWDGFLKHLGTIQKKFKEDVGKKAMESALIFLEARVKESIRNKFRKTVRSSGDKRGIGAQGRLSTDWTHMVDVKGKDITGIVGTHVKYARIHELGGTITPKLKRALTIPIQTKAYPPAKDLVGQGNTFAKNGIIFLKASGNISTKYSGQAGLKGRYIPIYLLRNTVTIPKRPYLRPVLDRYGKAISQIFHKMSYDVFKK